jgi:hypothetical protein
MVIRASIARSVVLVALFLASSAVLIPHRAEATTSTPVMGASKVTAADLANFFRSKGKVSKATVSIDELAKLYIEEGAAEGVAGDLAFAQSIIETGWFVGSARVPPSFNNFSGLGAVDGGSGAAAFPSARIGVRAQIQHLRAYADPKVTTSTLANPNVDPRFHLVLPKGKARTWEQFGNGIWASAPDYAAKVLGIHRQIVAFAGTTVDDRWSPFASPESLVAQGYDDLLGRPATAAEIATASAQLRSGAAPASMLAGLVGGEGARLGQPVTRLYLAALGRLPDRGGLRFWTARHRSGTSLRQIADQLMGSSEYARRYGTPTDQEFVYVLYRNVLGRASDPTGASYWTARVASGGVTRSSTSASRRSTSDGPGPPPRPPSSTWAWSFAGRTPRCSPGGPPSDRSRPTSGSWWSWSTTRAPTGPGSTEPLALRGRRTQRSSSPAAAESTSHTTRSAAMRAAGSSSSAATAARAAALASPSTVTNASRARAIPAKVRVIRG